MFKPKLGFGVSLNLKFLVQVPVSELHLLGKYLKKAFKNTLEYYLYYKFVNFPHT